MSTNENQNMAGIFPFGDKASPEYFTGTIGIHIPLVKSLFVPKEQVIIGKRESLFKNFRSGML